MAGPNWVVLKATHPSWCTAQLPGEVAELLGCRAEDLAPLTRPARGIAFLDRGPGVVRVVGMHRSARLLSVEMTANRVVDVAQLTEKMLFNIPDAVERHLGLKTYPRGDRGAQGTDDTLLWFLPETEYAFYRKETREGRGFPGLPDGETPHVYLTKALLGDFRPGLDAYERACEKGPAPLRPASPMLASGRRRGAR
jgi:hypothetical protein